MAHAQRRDSIRGSCPRGPHFQHPAVSPRRVFRERRVRRRLAGAEPTPAAGRAACRARLDRRRRVGAARVERVAVWGPAARADGDVRSGAAPAALLAGVLAGLADPLLGFLLARGVSRGAADRGAATLRLRLRQPVVVDAPPHVRSGLRPVSHHLQPHAVLLVQGPVVLLAVRDGGDRLPRQGVPALEARRREHAHLQPLVVPSGGGVGRRCCSSMRPT